MTHQTIAEPALQAPLHQELEAVVILDEKPLCRMGIVSFAAETTGARRVIAAATIEEARSALAEISRGMILVDLFTTNYDFGAIRRLLQAAPGVSALAVDDRINPTFARLAQDAGARGYAAKIQDEDVFRRAFRAVARGDTFFPAHPRRSSRGERPAAGLSPRQLDVLKKLAGGASNKEIAEALGIAPGTVKLHIHAILKLTGARNRTEAALIAGRFIAPNLG